MGGTGRKLPKRHGYKQSAKGSMISSKFPGCIGTYPDCKDYTSDMSIENRPECRTCPFK